MSHGGRIRAQNVISHHGRISPESGVSHGGRTPAQSRIPHDGRTRLQVNKCTDRHVDELNSCLKENTTHRRNGSGGVKHVTRAVVICFGNYVICEGHQKVSPPPHGRFAKLPKTQKVSEGNSRGEGELDSVSSCQLFGAHDWSVVCTKQVDSCVTTYLPIGYQ